MRLKPKTRQGKSEDRLNSSSTLRLHLALKERSQMIARKDTYNFDKKNSTNEVIISAGGAGSNNEKI